MQADARNQALVALGQELQPLGYRFATVTPASHLRVNSRPENRGDVIGGHFRVESAVPARRFSATHRRLAGEGRRAGGSRRFVAQQGSLLHARRSILRAFVVSDRIAGRGFFRPRHLPLRTGLAAGDGRAWRSSGSLHDHRYRLRQRRGGLVRGAAIGAARRCRGHPVRHQSEGAALRPRQRGAQPDTECADRAQRRVRPDQ